MKLTLMAYELEEPLAALMSSSARHSAIDLTLRKADSRVYLNQVISIFTAPQKKEILHTPMVMRAIAWLTRRRGDTSTA